MEVAHPTLVSSHQHGAITRLPRRHAAPSQPSATLPTRPQAILENSNSPYAQLLASSSLLKVVTDHALRYAAPMIRARTISWEVHIRRLTRGTWLLYGSGP